MYCKIPENLVEGITDDIHPYFVNNADAASASDRMSTDASPHLIRVLLFVILTLCNRKI